MDVQFSVVDGVEFATLPAVDLRRLMAETEDRNDARAAAMAGARRAGGEEYIPIAVVKRIVAGENPLRVWRQHRGLTLDRLGSFAGVKASYLSEIELGKKPGTPGVWRKLASALDVAVDDIMPDSD